MVREIDDEHEEWSLCFLNCSRSIGLERDNEHVLSSYTSINSDNQYEINDDPTPYCQSTLKSLTVGQRQICLLHPDHMPVVVQGNTSIHAQSNATLSCLGASKGIEECQNQFQDRHWNCSLFHDGSVFGPVLYHGKSIIQFISNKICLMFSQSRNCLCSCHALRWSDLCH